MMQRPTASTGASVKDELAAWDRMLRHLYESTETPQTAVRAHLTAEASAVFEAEHAAIRNAVADSETLTPAFASHLGKHSGMVARVALTFHLLKQERTEGVAASTMEMAIRFMRTARRHAAALFLDVLQGSPVRELARSMGRAIAAGAAAQEPLSRAWLSSHCRPFRDAADWQRRAAVAFLEDAGWIRPVPNSRPYAGWSATAWELNPSVCERFSNVGDEHRQRRARVNAAIMGEDA